MRGSGRRRSAEKLGAAAGAGWFPSHRSVHRVAVPHPPFEPTDEFLHAEPEAEHVQGTLGRAVAADSVAIRHDHGVLGECRRRAGAHGPVRDVDGAGDVGVLVVFWRSRIHDDDLLATGERGCQIGRVDLVRKLRLVVPFLIVHEGMVDEAATLREHLHGEICVGLNAAPSFLKVPQLIGAVRRSQPGLLIRLVASSTGHIVKQLSNRTLGAGFVFGPVTQEGLAKILLGEVLLVVATPSVWESELRQPPRWDDLAERPWIGSTVNCPFEAISDGLFARHGRMPPKVVMTDDGPTKVDLIRAGTGAALLEQSEAEDAAAQGGMMLWAPGALRCPLHFAWPAARDGDPAVVAVRSTVARLWERDSA